MKRRRALIVFTLLSLALLTSALLPAYAQTPVAMTVSYVIAGGGSPPAPVLNYVHGGTQAVYSLTSTPTAITADEGTIWSVTPNPLTGSNQSERWLADNGTLSGYALNQAVKFTFQHQYYLTIVSSLNALGIVTPSSGWYNAGVTLQIQAVQIASYPFTEWVGRGNGSYTGPENPANIIMNSPIVERAMFPNVVDEFTDTLVSLVAVIALACLVLNKRQMLQNRKAKG